MERQLSRRKFLIAAAGAGAAAALPVEVWRVSILGAARAAAAAGPDPTYYFFTGDEAATCTAICAQIVPSISPGGGGPPVGATEAQASLYIDRFLAAFELPSSVADNPAIYLHGRWSGRNPFGDNADGEPSSNYPADQFLSSAGQVHFIALTPLQMLSWRSLLVGLSTALGEGPSYASTTWASQVTAGTIPGPPSGGLQAVYSQGLAAFDSYSESLYGTPFAQATPQEQAQMVAEAGDPVIGVAPPPPPAGPPPAAIALFPYIALHTFQGCYGLPEYRSMSGEASTFMWNLIGWDGDTQPLGNSIYDENLYGVGQGPNAGFGEKGIYQPRGGYREFRAVSYLDNEGSVLTEVQVQQLVDALQLRGIIP